MIEVKLAKCVVFVTEAEFLSLPTTKIFGRERLSGARPSCEPGPRGAAGRARHTERRPGALIVPSPREEPAPEDGRTPEATQCRFGTRYLPAWSGRWRNRFATGEQDTCTSEMAAL
jgi:hypothetical protein